MLADGATAGLVLSGADATVVEGGREAFSTAIELLASGETLLCTQRWGSRGSGDGGGDGGCHSDDTYSSSGYSSADGAGSEGDAGGGGDGDSDAGGGVDVVARGR